MAQPEPTRPRASIEALLREERRFPPPEEFRARAHVNDSTLYADAEEDLEAFWARWSEEIEWIEPWKEVLRWDPPRAEWFIGGKLNVSRNCVDRHAFGPRKNKAAVIWEGEPGDSRTLTYYDLYREVTRFAGALRSLGVEKGDRVTMYLPMIPELVIAMLACARIGAPHSVVFAGFSPAALASRVNDSESKVVITCDGYYRRGRLLDQKARTEEGLAETPGVEKVIVVQRSGSEIGWKDGRDLWWHELVAGRKADCPPEPMDSEDMLFMMYTSGTTGKPKGVIHTTGGYLTGVHATAKMVFDLKDEDTYWCMADIGWITGHSYIVYGPLSNGATMVMYEGAPDWPDPARPWEIIEKYNVNILYTAPTAIRAFMRAGVEHPEKHDLSSLRLLGTVGEPINPEAWVWYHRHIGGGRCPIVDTWWQTENGMILLTPLPGVTTTKPGSVTRPLPGVKAVILDDEGKPVPANEGGYLAIQGPWPAMLRGLWRDDERFIEEYWSKWPGVYYTSDGARVDEDGDFWIMGRLDDVLTVAGHRLGTMELESALVGHEAVAEAAVVGAPDDLRGQVPAAFVILKAGFEASPALEKELIKQVDQGVGPIARPHTITFVSDLPKTRSGKIMRRLLKNIVADEPLGDVTTLANPDIASQIQRVYAGEV